jgi:hypothetical protein
MATGNNEKPLIFFVSVLLLNSAGKTRPKPGNWLFRKKILVIRNLL